MNNLSSKDIGLLIEGLLALDERSKQERNLLIKEAQTDIGMFAKYRELCRKGDDIQVLINLLRQNDASF